MLRLLALYVKTLFSIGRKAVFYFFLLWLDCVKPRQTFVTVTHTNKNSDGAVVEILFIYDLYVSIFNGSFIISAATRRYSSAVK